MKPKNRIKPAEHDTPKDQNQQSTTIEQKAQPVHSDKGVFLMRAKGMSFDEFKKACIQSFREAGLIKD